MREDGKGRQDSTRADTPVRTEDQSAPQPERLERPAEEAGMAPHQREHPPQAEGPRDDEEAEGEEAEDRKNGG